MTGLLNLALGSSFDWAGRSDHPARAAAEPAPQAAEEDTVEEQVRAAYQAYRTAMLAQDGTAMAKLVDGPILQYYETIVTNALELPKDELVALPPMDFLMVLLLRTRHNRASLNDLKGTAFQGLSADPRFVDPGLAQAIPELATVKLLDDDHAMASIPMDPAQFVLPFVRESDGWKFDQTALLKQVSADVPQDSNVDYNTEEGERTLLFTLNLTRSMKGEEPLEADRLKALLEGPTD
ncbi:MAG: hypothetical protein AAGA48_18880 [Myxococcota bacterium]